MSEALLEEIRGQLITSQMRALCPCWRQSRREVTAEAPAQLAGILAVCLSSWMRQGAPYTTQQPLSECGGRSGEKGFATTNTVSTNINKRLCATHGETGLILSNVNKGPLEWERRCPRKPFDFFGVWSGVCTLKSGTGKLGVDLVTMAWLSNFEFQSISSSSSLSSCSCFKRRQK